MLRGMTGKALCRPGFIPAKRRTRRSRHRRWRRYNTSGLTCGGWIDECGHAAIRFGHGHGGSETCSDTNFREAQGTVEQAYICALHERSILETVAGLLTICPPLPQGLV